MTDLGLKATGLKKFFGGLAAVDNVSLEVNRGVLHALIGPNGAGKSTLINLLSGDLVPTAGNIYLDQREIVGCSPDQRSRLGLCRIYQQTSIFPSFSVLENCRLAAQSRQPHAVNHFRRAEAYPSLMQEAERALTAVGLLNRAKAIAGHLSPGEPRQPDVARSLATRPRGP